MAAVTCELKWLKGLLHSLDVNHLQAINLYSDSQSALYLAQNLVFLLRTEHIEVDCHFYEMQFKMVRLDLHMFLLIHN